MSTLKILDADANPVYMKVTGAGSAMDPYISSINVDSVALASGSATAAKQDTGNTSLATIATTIASQATAAKQDTGNTSLASIITVLGSQATAAAQATAQTSLDTLATASSSQATAAKQDTGNTSLNTIATASSLQATASKQDTGNSSLASIVTLLGSQATASKQDTGNTSLASIVTNTTSIATAAKQDTGNTSLGTIATATVSQATAAKQDTGNTSLASIVTALSSQATASKQDTGNTSVASIDTKTPALGQALAAASVPVVLTASQLTTLTPPAAISGFATASKQDTGNTSLGTIATNLPAQGQALAAASLPVVLTASQLTTLTPPAAITGFATSVKQDTGNTSIASIDAKTPNLGQALAAACVPVVLSATQLTSIISPTLSAGSSIIGKVGIDQTTPGTTNAVAATNLPTTVDTNSGSKSANTLRVVLATDQPQLTNKLLVTPDANSAINLAQVGGGLTAVGHGTAATALRVELPTDGTGLVNAAQSGTWNVTNVSGTVSLPTGAATAAKQDTGNTSLSSIDSKFPALGQALAGASIPVVLTVAQLNSLTTPVLSAGISLIGKVGLDQTTPGTTNAVSIAQLGANTIATGNGTASTGCQRVAVVSDNTPFATKIDQTTPGTTDSVTVKSTGYVSQITVTRPANTTAYTAGDVVGATAAAITFTNIGPSGGHVVINGADLRIDVSAIPSGMTTFRLHLYDVTPPSALADNAAWDLPSGDHASYLGYIDLGTVLDLGSTLFVENDTVVKKIKLNASTSLFGYLVTTAGFTPAGNSEVYTPRLQSVGV